MKINYKDYCVLSKLTDNKTVQITRQMLDKLCKQAKKMSKKPLLILGLRKDDEEIYKVHCEVSKEKLKK